MNDVLQQQIRTAQAAITVNGEGTSDAAQTPVITLEWDKDLCEKHTPLPPALISGYLNRGEVAILSGASKKGKSWLALQAAKCIGSGQKFLECDTTRGTCIYLNTEVASPYWEQRSREVNKALGLTSFPNVLHACTRGQPLTIHNVIPALKAAIASSGLKEIDLVVVDPYYVLTAGLDENAAGEVADVMLRFQQLAEDLKAGVLITHHFAKGNASGKTMIDRASGSGVFGRSVDNFFTITENSEGKTILEATRRNAASPPPLEIEFRYPIWEKIGEAEAIVPKRPGRKSGYNAEDFVKAFKAETRMYPSAIKKNMGVPAATFSRWKQKAVEDGIIEEGDRYIYLTDKGKAMKPPEPAMKPPEPDSETPGNLLSLEMIPELWDFSDLSDSVEK